MSDSPTHLTMKPRSTSTLDAWSKEQSEPLDHWRFEVNRSYEEVGGWLAKEHGVTTTKPSLSRYYRRPLAPWRQARALSDARTRGTSRQVPPAIPADQRELHLVAEDHGSKKI